ncbi:divisome protein SepX/GlpR [Mycobacterium sp.]|jgi:lipoprotein signal peptidase|uniref:divisome protein SepX/GlpR n=1 Tax=Mycobacterium sp. TaxID=1785 RepID=UPI003F9509C1
MPSIPQSLLWISLVVLWLFVLVPMLISKRDAVRRTSDVALATRVLNSGAAARLIKRGGPAAGHRSNPDWQPEEDEYDDLDSDDAEEAPPSRVVVAAAAAVFVEETGPDYLDVDVIDPDSAALPAGTTAAVAETPPAADDGAADDPDAEVNLAVEHDDDDDDFDDDGADQYEYVDDTSGIPVAEEPPTTVTPAFSRRHRYDADTAAAVEARKYAFRRRVLTIMAMTLVASAGAAFLLTSAAWWFCGMTSTVTVLYLGYLRRQTRIEERVRRRRMHRMARSQLGVENTYDREFEVVPSRLRRPGAVVLEIDDEDPVFEHLDYAPYARDYGWQRDLPRAAGQ